MTHVSTTDDTTITQFGEMIGRAISEMIEACKMYVRDIDTHKGKASKYRAAYPDIPAASWKGFEAVGRGVLLPQLLWADSPGTRALSKLPVSTQRHYINSTVEMLTAEGDTLNVDPKEMSAKQARQVFTATHIRTLGEQRAWMEDQRKPTDPESLPYEIRGGELVVRRPVTFTRKQLQQLLMEV
jgi:hypothetical protein